MTNNYDIVFNVNVWHSYYVDGLCRDLIYQPSKATEALMQRYGFKMINDNNGFSLLANQSNSLEEYLNYIENITDDNAFSFNISTNNSKFYQFTDQLSIDNIGYLQYTSNTSKPTENEIVLNGKFTNVASTLNVLQLDILFSDIILYRTTDLPINFKIELDARATQWEYNIVNSNNQYFDTLTIESNSDIEFSEPKMITLANNQVAQCFSSKATKISLKERPEYSFDLVSTTQKLGQTRQKTIFKGLPYPDPGTLTIDHNTKVVTSLAYVYI